MNKAEAHHDGHSAKVAVLKVSYLLAVTAVTFMVPAFSRTPSGEWFVIPALLALQAIVLLACRIDPYEIVRPVWRLKWLFVFLILLYALLPVETPSDAFLEWRIPGVQWRWTDTTWISSGFLMPVYELNPIRPLWQLTCTWQF